MLILNQDKTELINLDRITMISEEYDMDSDTKDYVARGDEYTAYLGTYSGDSESVLEKIAQSAGAINVFHMP